MRSSRFLTFLIALLSFTAKAQTWVPLVSGTSDHLLSLHFTDDNTGYVVGTNGAILKTTNAGTTWTPQSSGSFSSFYSTFFTSALNGWAVGDGGTIRHTTDGGNAWNPVSTPVNGQDLRVVWFLDPNIGFIAGGFSGFSATIIKTTDGGATWTDISPNTGQVIYGIFFTSPLVGYASDFDGNMLKTTDGGGSWTAQFVSPNNLHGIYFTDAQTGFVAGGTVGTDTGIILKTVNGGNSWAPIFASPAFLTDIKFFGSNKGFAVGGSVSNNTGLILKTTDAGNTWSAETINPSPTSRQFRVFMPSAQTAYSCGLNGTILRTSAPSFVLPPSEDLTVACLAAAQLVPTPPAVNNTCGDPIQPTGPIVSADPSCSGDKTYTWTYLDCTGIAADWVYTYHIDPPTFSIPSPGGSTVACVADAQVIPTAPVIQNSCGAPVTMTGPVAIGDPSCSGIKTYTWTYTDCTGATADWVYIYTINPPSFNLPLWAETTVACIADAQAIPTPPLVQNSCGDLMNLTGPVVDADPICSGRKSYTWIYTDCTGASAEWKYSYIVALPTFTLPASGGSTVSCLAAAQVVPAPPVVNSFCGDPLLISAPVVSADPVCSGTKTYTWTYTDCAGVSATWQYVYTIAAPSFNLPAPGGSMVNCIAAAQVVPIPPVVNSSCGTPLVATGPVVSANPSCSGAKAYTWTYTDCSGIAAQWVYTYTINPPSFILPAPGGSTVNCVDALVAPIPPVVLGSCGTPLVVTGPVLGGNPNCSGVKTYTWTYTDCTGNTADWVYTYTLLPEPACDVKTIGCLKYELLTISEAPNHNHTYRIRVTNNCGNKLSYFAVQLPNGILAKAPLNDAIITAEGGRLYKVRSPNYSPFYSVRFSSQADSLSNGQSEIFQYTLPPQAAVPTFIHVIARLEPQVFYEAHLNTFGCDIDHSTNRDQAMEQLRQSAYLIYPNPSSGNFSLELSEPAIAGMSFRIMDITGKWMLSQEAVPGTAVQAFEVGALPPGLYFLQVVLEGRLLGVEKFVKG